MIVKPTKPAHYGELRNRFTFEEAYEYIMEEPDREYRTTGNQTPFIAVASRAVKGQHKGTKVIIFKTEGKEKARSHPCCWGHLTNCNRTYIDCYTKAI